MNDKVNVLAVDDSPDKLLALSVVLAELNQNVVTATSGREALRALLTDEFSVVLLDVNMPGMDGFETAAMIRQRKATEHTPSIFITAATVRPSSTAMMAITTSNSMSVNAARRCPVRRNMIGVPL